MSIESTVNLKLLAPRACNDPYSELEYTNKDPLNNNKASVTWWTGPNSDDCDGRYEIVFKQTRQKMFEIPGIPYKFIVVSNKIFYRRNVE